MKLKPTTTPFWMYPMIDASMACKGKPFQFIPYKNITFKTVVRNKKTSLLRCINGFIWVNNSEIQK